MAQVADPESWEAIAERIELIRLGYSIVLGRNEPLDQAEIAAMCGMTRQMWNHVERARARIGLDNAKAVYKRTGADLLYIYYGDERRLPHDLHAAIERIKRERASSRGKTG